MDGLSMLNAMTAKMRWHQQRQEVLAQNVANANTPNFAGQELAPFAIDDAGAVPGLPAILADRADARHIAASPLAGDGAGDAGQEVNFEVTPEGSGVTIEDEMMKVSANQMDYEAVTTLYTKSLALIRTAIGAA